jgi:cell division protein FtsL
MATLDRLGPPAAASPVEGRAAWKPRRAIAVALTVAAAIALLQVVLSSTFTHTGQQLRDLENQRDQLQAQIYQTEADVAALSSLDRTERIARDRLGMVPAHVSQYISVDVEAPRGALLPQPIVQLPSQDGSQDTSENQPWWKTLIKALPLP